MLAKITAKGGIMSSVDVVELGRKWFAVTLNFNEYERARLNERALGLNGAKLRYPASGGMRAKFHFNLRENGCSTEMLHLMNIFGEGGLFDSEAGKFDYFSADKAENENSMAEVEKRATTLAETWTVNWQNEAAICLREKLGRIQTIRRVCEVAGENVAEEEIRAFLEKELRKRYKSDIFGATILWRMGWPDTRPAQKKAPVIADDDDISANSNSRMLAV